MNSFIRSGAAGTASGSMDLRSSVIQVATMLIRWVNHVLIHEEGIHAFSTVETYLTHIKDHHKRKCEEAQTKEAYTFKFPERVRGVFSCLPLQAAIDNAKEFYIEFEGRGRSALTPGLIVEFLKHMDLSDPLDLLTAGAMVATSNAGVRAGEVLSPEFTPNKISINRDIVTFTVTNDKAGGRKTQTATAFSKEWVPVATHFNTGVLDVYQIMTEIEKAKIGDSTSDPFFSIGGTTLTYARYYGRLRGLSKLVGLPPGKIGPHSGRIYKATLMGHQGQSKAVIKGRGRWVGKSWGRYTRLCIIPMNKDSFWIRLGHIDTDVTKCPNSHEFQRGSFY